MYTCLLNIKVSYYKVTTTYCSGRLCKSLNYFDIYQLSLYIYIDTILLLLLYYLLSIQYGVIVWNSKYVLTFPETKQTYLPVVK